MVADVPLAARMRPRTFEEFVGQRHLFGPAKALTTLIEGGHLPSMLLWGPAGTGKTTLAYLLADAVGAELQQLSAVSSGVAAARKVMQGARGVRGGSSPRAAQPRLTSASEPPDWENGMLRTGLFVDEDHRWSKAQQDVLLPAVEDGTITLIGATTENPYFSPGTPPPSRCLLLRLEPLSAADTPEVLERAPADADPGPGRIAGKVEPAALD